MSERQQNSSYTNTLSTKLKGHEDLEEFQFCDDSNKYAKLAKIGQGSYGKVFKARDKKTREIVAMKKILMFDETEELPITALREIKILQSLNNENVVNLIGTCRTKGTPYNRYNSKFYLILEYCEHDLAGLLGNANVKFSLGAIKNVMQQLLYGLYFIHSNEIMHRDLKPENILITKNGVLKIADFGLAREFSLATKKNQPKEYTNGVVTLWYRPPELLLGERNYTTAIDMWGAGCIMAEMWTRSPIIQGDSEQHQLYLIILMCGSINPEVWPGVDQFELYRSLELPQGQKRKVKERLESFVKDELALDLLDKLLSLDPSKRIDSDTALNNNFFWTDPMPTDLYPMLSRYRRRGPNLPDNPNLFPTQNPDHHFEIVF